jgi:hypothetical protein
MDSGAARDHFCTRPPLQAVSLPHLVAGLYGPPAPLRPSIGRMTVFIQIEHVIIMSYGQTATHRILHHRPPHEVEEYKEVLHWTQITQSLDFTVDP